MNKLFLLLACYCLSFKVAGQTVWKNPLPVDSVTHRVSYSGVVEVPGATKAELYSRAREWFANTFGSSKAVLEMDDRESGKLIGNANAETSIDYGGILGTAPTRLWRTIRVEIKEGRYRYTFTNFDMGALSGLQAEAHPIEAWFKPSSLIYNKDGSPKRAAASIFKGVQQSGESQVSSLHEAMTKSAGKAW